MLIGFLIYTTFCAWVLFLGGAERIEGWMAAVAIDLFAGMLDARHLKGYVAILWVAALVQLLLA